MRSLHAARAIPQQIIGTYSGTVHQKGNPSPLDFTLTIDQQDANGAITGAMSFGADLFAVTGTIKGHSLLAVCEGPTAVGEISCAFSRTGLHGRLLRTIDGITTTTAIKARASGTAVAPPDSGPAVGALNEANVLGRHDGTISFGGHKHTVALIVSDESNDGLLTGTLSGTDIGSFSAQGIIWAKGFAFVLTGDGAGTLTGSLTHAGHLRGALVSVSGAGVLHGHVDLPPAVSLPHYDHVVVVMEENHSFDQILGSSAADDPYMQSLAAAGASFTDSHAITHSSLPNYLAIFSGSTQGVADNTTPPPIDQPNLASELAAAGLSFAGYSDSLPSVGFTGESSGDYVRRHNPWVDFSNVPASANQPFSNFPSDFSTLPNVSFVVPNLQHDMHDGTIAQADQWLSDNVGSYASWAQTHNSLLIVTWDEDDGSTANNQIPTIFAGEHVTPGTYDQSINHYSVLRTIEAIEGLPPLANSADVQPINVFG